MDIKARQENTTPATWDAGEMVFVDGGDGTASMYVTSASGVPRRVIGGDGSAALYADGAGGALTLYREVADTPATALARSGTPTSAPVIPANVLNATMFFRVLSATPLTGVQIGGLALSNGPVQAFITQHTSDAGRTFQGQVAESGALTPQAGGHRATFAGGVTLHPNTLYGLRLGNSQSGVAPQVQLASTATSTGQGWSGLVLDPYLRWYTNSGTMGEATYATPAATPAFDVLFEVPTASTPDEALLTIVPGAGLGGFVQGRTITLTLNQSTLDRLATVESANTQQEADLNDVIVRVSTLEANGGGAGGGAGGGNGLAYTQTNPVPLRNIAGQELARNVDLTQYGQMATSGQIRVRFTLTQMQNNVQFGTFTEWRGGTNQYRHRLYASEPNGAISGTPISDALTPPYAGGSGSTTTLWSEHPLALAPGAYELEITRGPNADFAGWGGETMFIYDNTAAYGALPLGVTHTGTSINGFLYIAPANRTANSVGFYFRAGAKTKGTTGTLDPADVPVVTSVAALSGAGVALLDDGTNPPRLLRRRADGTVWYSNPFSNAT